MTRPGFRLVVVVLPLTLTAMACGDPGSPGDRAAASLVIVSGNGQPTLRGDDAPEPLRVRVLDDDGRPVSGATVAWSMTQGEATLSSNQTVTEQNGEAEVRATHIATVGELLVRAAAGARTGPNAPADTFSLIAADPCLIGSSQPYALGTVRQGELRSLDCEQGDGQIYDFHEFVLPAQQAIVIRMTSQSFAPGVFLVPTIENRPRGGSMDLEGLSRETILEWILPADRYTLALTSAPAGSTGFYELSVLPAPPSADDCEVVMIVRGISTNQRLDASDCSVDGATPAGTSAGDSFWIPLYAGERLSVVQSSSDFVPRLRLNDREGRLITESLASAAGTATLEFTAAAPIAFYEIIASSVAAGQSGEYSLSVTQPEGA